MYVTFFFSRGRDFQSSAREDLYDQERHLLSDDIVRTSNVAIGPGSDIVPGSTDARIGLFDPLTSTFSPAYGLDAAGSALTAASGGYFFDFSQFSASATVTGGNWSDQISGGSANDVLSGGSGRDQLNGGLGNDVLDGGANSDRLDGGAGNDWLKGGTSYDRLDGGSGNDKLEGGAGNDSYIVDSYTDRVLEAVGGGRDTVTTTVSYALSASSEIETAKLAASTGSNPLNLVGNEFANTLVGNDGVNRISGGAGVDVLQGGKGNDIYYVDDWSDEVLEAVGGGRDTVYASADHCLVDGQEVEVLKANAGSKGLHIMGNELAQTIIGGAGDDIIHGDGGADILRGQGGRDTFAFVARVDATPGTARPTIVDFKRGEDSIFLKKLQAVDTATSDQPFTWIGTGAFTKQAGQLHQVKLGVDTLVEGDTNGDGAADIQILLKGVYDLQASDFTL